MQNRLLSKTVVLRSRAAKQSELLIGLIRQLRNCQHVLAKRMHTGSDIGDDVHALTHVALEVGTEKVEKCEG